jgi:hypothetical protein
MNSVARASADPVENVRAGKAGTESKAGSHATPRLKGR